jgi:hypothetical protein
MTCHAAGDRFELHASSDETEYVGASGVEPVGVLDDDEERRLARSLRKQLQGRQRDQEDVGRAPLDHPERGGERIPLGRWKRADLREQGVQEPVQAGKRHPRFERRAGGAEHRHAERFGPFRGLVEQGRLSDAGMDVRQRAAPEDRPGRRDVVALVQRATPPR